MKWFFSGKGDEGKSSLNDGVPLKKNDPAFELIGTLDEMNAALGMARSFCEDEAIGDDLSYLQKITSALMGVIAGFPLSADGNRTGLVEFLEWIENRIHFYGGSVDNPQQFIFPGESKVGAALDQARTIVRRAERRAVDYCDEKTDLDPEILAVMNRLSSLLFIMRLYFDIL